LSSTVGALAGSITSAASTIVNALINFINVVNTYSQKMSEIRVARANIQADSAIEIDDMISKWQDFRKVMEHIKDNDYLGKLK